LFYIFCFIVFNVHILSGKDLKHIGTMDTGMVERRYRAVRNHLDGLGYRYPLALESLSLVERIVSDLLHTTERLRHYKELSQKSLEV
jgi:hypothetical protein